MRKVGPFLVWLVATSVSGFLAWSVVTVAGAGATADVADPLTIAEIQAFDVRVATAPAAPQSTTTNATAQSTAPTETSPPTGEQTTGQDETTTSATGATASSATTTPPATPAPTTTTVPENSTSTTIVDSTTTTSTTAPASTTTTVPEDTTTTTTAPASTESIVYHLEGGSVGISYTESELIFDWASPNDGFHVEEVEEHTTVIEVEFVSSDHESTLKVVLEDDGPHHQIEEEPK